jgi:hypothetical protein
VSEDDYHTLHGFVLQKEVILDRRSAIKELVDLSSKAFGFKHIVPYFMSCVEAGICCSKFSTKLLISMKVFLSPKGAIDPLALCDG